MTEHKSCARRGFAVALAAGSLCMLMILGGSLGFISSGASRAVVRNAGDHACHDVCLSALAEALVTISADLREPKLREALRREFPFPPVSLETPAARALAKRLHPGLTLGQVTFKPLARSAPGQEDPLVGTVELSVSARGRVNGVWTSLAVSQVFPFRVRCAAFSQHGKRGSYLRFHWGEAFLSASPLGQAVKPL